MLERGIEPKSGAGKPESHYGRVKLWSELVFMQFSVGNNLSARRKNLNGLAAGVSKHGGQSRVVWNETNKVESR
jgi:hypothetical protein